MGLPTCAKTCPFWLWKSRRQTDTFRLRELSDDHFRSTYLSGEVWLRTQFSTTALGDSGATAP